MINKNKNILLAHKSENKINLIKLARESKKERIWKLSWNM